MRKIDLSNIGLSTAGFRDGIGERLLGFDRAAGETLELLRVRPELATLETVLVARVGNLTGFKNSRFLGLRGVAKNCTRTFIVSNRVESERLSEVLARAHAHRLVPDIGLALHVVREILQALATLERSHKTAHGAVGPERILVTPRGRIMLAEHMLAPALQRLAFSPAFLWREMRIAMPAKPSPPRFDARADIAQVAMVLLALAIGRPVREDEFPDQVKVLAGDVREAVAKWGGADLADAIGAWLDAALPVHRRTGGFASTAEAQVKLDQALARVTASIGSAQGLAAFLTRLEAPDEIEAEPGAGETASGPALTIAGAVPSAEPAFEIPETITAEDLLPILVEPPAAGIAAPALVAPEPEIESPEIVESPPESAIPDLPASAAEIDTFAATAASMPPPAPPPALEAETAAEVTMLLDELFDQAEALGRTDVVDTPEPERLEPPTADAPPAALDAIELVPAVDVPSIEPGHLAGESPFEAIAPAETIDVAGEPIVEHAIEVTPVVEPPPPAGGSFTGETRPIVEAQPVVEEAPAGDIWLGAEFAPTVEEPALTEAPSAVEAVPVVEQWPVIETAPFQAVVEQRPAWSVTPPSPAPAPPPIETPPAGATSSTSVFNFTVPPPASPPPVEPPRPQAAAPVPPPPPPAAPEARPRLIADADLSKLPDWMANPDEVGEVAPPTTPAKRPPVKDESLWRETVVAPMRPAPERIEAPATGDDPLERARRILQTEQRKREAAEALEALQAERAAEEEARIRARRRLVRVAAIVFIAALCAGGGFLGWKWWKARTAPGTLVVESQPPGSEILVDGQAKGKTPASLTLPPGRHSLELRLGERTSTYDVRVPAGRTVTQAVDWSKQIDTGSLKVTSEPEGARVSVDGQVRGKTPLELTDLPAGRHTVVVATARGTVTEQVTVQRNEVATVHASVYSGWLAVFAPVELQIYERNRLIGTTSDGRILVAPGRHQVDLVNEELGYRASETFTVRPGEISSISIEPKGQVNVNASPWAEVFVDGQRLGETPIANAPVTVGLREFVFKHPDYGERRVTVTVTMKETTRVNVDMTKE